MKPEGNLLEWGPCVRCDETVVVLLIHRRSEAPYDGTWGSPTCRNPDCVMPSDKDPDGIRMTLPLTSHKVVEITHSEIIDVINEVDLSMLDEHSAPPDHEHVLHLKTGICIYCKSEEEE